MIKVLCNMDKMYMYVPVCTRLALMIYYPPQPPPPPQPQDYLSTCCTVHTCTCM